jgi:hypothetical protein
MVGTRQLLRSKGYWVEGHVPIGYVRPDKKASTRAEYNILNVDPRGAEIVREVFRLYLRGESIAEIVDEMQSQHTWRRWDKKLVGRILHNRTYLGEIECTDGTFVKGQHAAIITPDVFTRAQEIATGKRNNGSGHRTESLTSTWLLRVIGHCMRCEAKLSSSYGRWKKPEFEFYYRCLRGCRPYIRVRDVDPVVSEMAVERLIELRHELARGPSESKPAKDLTAEREKLQRKRERTLEAFSDGHMNKSELADALARIDTARLKLDAKEAEQSRQVTAKDMRAALALVENIRKAWGRASWQIRREALHELATRVLIARGETPVVYWKTAEEIAGKVA